MELDLVPDRPDEMEAWPSSVSSKRKGGDAALLPREGGVSDLSMGSSFSFLSVQVPSSPCSSVQVPPKDSPFGENCTQMRGPDGTQGDFGQFAYEELRHLRRPRGYEWKVSQAALKTRLSTMDTMDRKRAQDVVGAVALSDDLPEVCGRRRRVGDLHWASIAGKEVAEERTQRRDPRIKVGWNVVDASPQGGVGAVISAWAADQCGKFPGQELSVGG